MSNYIDAHCHIKSPVLSPGQCIINASQISEWDEIITQAATFPAAIGIHPWYIDDLPTDWVARLEQKLADNPNLMVGEIGLDRMRANFDRQIEIFTRQMEIAVRFNRTACIHCVRAWDVMLGILGRMRSLPPAIIMHGYRANTEITHALGVYGMIYYSFSRVVPAAGLVPQNRILIETDGTRGINLGDLVTQMAALRGIDMAQLADIIYHNTQRVMNHGQIKSD